MSINKLISIKTPIFDAMIEAGIDDDKNIPVFTRWATLAEKNIGSVYQYVKTIKVLDIENCTACLPEDAAFIQRAILGDYGCDCADLFSRFCANYYGNTTTMATSVDNNSFLVVDLGLTTSSGYTIINYQIQNNKIIFEKNLNGQKITIQYLAYATDDEGFLKVGENHVEAITNFILWKYYMRKKRPSNEDFFKMKEYKAEWHRKCADARAKDSELTESERQKIVNMHHDPHIGYGLSVGMYPTNGSYIW